MWSLADELVDLDKLYTSDIYAILQTYGVEACRTAIINEMAAVFGVYGIKVDYRHRTVIADYMVSPPFFSSFFPAPLLSNPLFSLRFFEVISKGQS
jgi:DNA-directed RNA polymerase I subunit RPA1